MTIDEKRLEATLKLQRGVLTKLQAESYGFPRGVIRQRLDSGAWQEFYPTVYQVESLPSSPEQRFIAAACWSSGYVSHESAAYLHQLDGFDQLPLGSIHVTVPKCRKLRPLKGLRIHHSRDVHASDITIIKDCPAFSEIRALIDVAPSADRRDLVMAFEDVVRRGKWPRLLKRFSALEAGRTGFEGLRELIHRRGPNPKPTESAPEALCDDILLRAGLISERQLVVRYGRRTARLDLAFVEFGIAIECDSSRWHAPKYEEDRDRDNWLLENGWVTVRITWKQLFNEVQVLRRITSLIDQRRGVTPPTLPAK